MDLEKQLSKPQSKLNCETIVNWIGRDPARFARLVELVLSGDPNISHRAAWPLSYAGTQHPATVKKYAGKLIRLLETPGLHNAITRNILRLFDQEPVATIHQGRLMNACFRFIADPLEKPAIQAFSLSILDELSRQYPGIRQDSLQS